MRIPYLHGPLAGLAHMQRRPVEKRFDRIKKRVDAMGGSSHPDPWVLALIAETANKPAKQQAIPKKKKVEVIPSA